MNNPTTRWLIIIALVLLIGVIHVMALRGGHLWGGDFAMYVLHARNLASCIPYGQTGYIYNPDYPVVGPPTYPPGLPVILAPVYMCFGLNLTAMKGLMIVCFGAVLATLCLYFHDRLSFGKLSALLAIVGLNHYLLLETNVITSDIPFLVFVYLAIFLIDRADRQEAGSPGATVYYLLAGVVVYFSYATRSAGLVLIPSILVLDLVRRRRITRPALLAVVVFGCLAFLQATLLHSDRAYFDQFGAGPTVLLHNAFLYAGRAVAFWHNGYFKAISAMMFAATTLLAVLGYVDCLRRRITVCEIFVVLYLGLILAWPSYQGERFLYPLFPPYVFYMLRGLEHPWIARRVRLRRVTSVCLLAAVSVSYAARYTSIDFSDLAEGAGKQESTELFAYIKDNTDPKDVVVFIKPRVMALFTSRRSSVYHETTDDAQLRDYFRRIGVTHVVVVTNDDAFRDMEFPSVLQFLRDFVDRNRERFDRVYANDDFSVYRVKPGT